MQAGHFLNLFISPLQYRILMHQSIRNLHMGSGLASAFDRVHKACYNLYQANSFIYTIKNSALTASFQKRIFLVTVTFSFSNTYMYIIDPRHNEFLIELLKNLPGRVTRMC